MNNKLIQSHFIFILITSLMMIGFSIYMLIYVTPHADPFLRIMFMIMPVYAVIRVFNWMFFTRRKRR